MLYMKFIPYFVFVYLLLSVSVSSLYSSGFCGALNEDARYLQLFLVLLAILLIWEIIYIIVSAVSYKASISTLAYDIALACILGLGVVFTADITRVSYGSRDVIV